MTVPLPDSVVDAINELAMALAGSNMRLADIRIERVKTKLYLQSYLLATPGGVVTVKQEM